MPKSSESLRDQFGGEEEDDDEEEDEPENAFLGAVETDDPNYRAPWDERPVAPPPRSGSVSQLGNAYEGILRPMDVFDALGEAPPAPTALDLDDVICLPTTWK